MAWTDAQIDAFFDRCNERLDVLQDAAEAEYGLGHFDRWTADVDAGVLHFHADGGDVDADFYAVGSVASDSFQWAWSNTTLPPALRTRSEGLKALAEETGLEIFALRKWGEAGEQEGWDMIAIAIERLGGVAGYRLPGSNADLYVVITALRDHRDRRVG
jgi:hypothetical protein